ncbi:hypothetical protein [Spongiibacter marinus]|uniref:hypothetical protein n=1 Tax=Spongiibacter marinus TaxID=354246 RepID=UPI0035BE4404
MIAAGATPAAGPSIDRCNVYVFNRQELADGAIIRDALSLKSYSKSGRKTAGTPTLDTNVWATATEAAKHIGVSIQLLSYLEGVTPLTQATPLNVPKKNTRYYRWDTVNSTKSFLERMVPAKKLASIIGVTEAKLLRRAGRLFKSPTVHMSNTTYLPADHANTLKHHFSNYWCSDIAANFLGCKRSDIDNWRRLGHLSAVDQNHPDFIEGIHLYDNNDIRQFKRPVRVYTTRSSYKKA